MRLAFPGLLAALAGGRTIVLPTPTLASVAIEQFNREQLKRGLQAWQRPAIYSLDAWMSRCWQQARFARPAAPLLLSPLQERELWRQIIAADRPDLFDLRAMAGLAQRAAGVVAEYRIPVEGNAWQEHADAREFRRWRETLQSRLQAENWMTRADLWRLLPGWISQGAVHPGQLAFPALAVTSPGLQSLFRALGDLVEQHGIVYGHRPPVANASEQSLEQVARSVRYLLEERDARSIGILVADLPSQLSDVTRVFDRVLYSSGVSGVGGSGEHVHVATGAWRENRLIAHALLILELAQERVPAALAGAILRSPFIEGAQKERSERARADLELRKGRELDYALIDLADAADHCPILFQILRRIGRDLKEQPASRRFPAWSSVFSTMLDVAGWPALNHPTEEEQEAIDVWSHALSDLASLGLVAPPTSLTEALAHLRAILGRRSERGNWSSPVQVVDADAAEAIEFDHCFVLNASEEAWPRPVAISPLIPYQLQRLQRVPGSDPASAGELRRRKTEGLLACAPRVEVRFTGQLSPAFREYTTPDIADGVPAWPGLTAGESYQATALDAQDDNEGPPLVTTDEVRGGASIIRSQSLCPFKAFAEYRLDAQGEELASIGFDALERGICLHRALQYIWEELRTQANLKALASEELSALIARHVERAVEEDAAGGPIRQLTSLAERERLRNVLLHWLEVEKKRAVSFTVEQLEEKLVAEVSGLKLKLRMDRVDRLADGGLLLIDYKSGAQTANKLTGQRPKEPQLLLYAAAMNEPVSGVYFGELRNRRVRPVGHGAGKHFPRERGTEEHGAKWGEFLEDAREAVQALAVEFRDGQAAVTPQSGACSYCQIKPLCRIGGAASSDEDDSDHG